MGCHLLRGLCPRSSTITATLWGSIVSQLAHSDATIHSATAALGAAVEYTRRRRTDGRTELIQRYGRAVHEIQGQFLTNTYDPFCIVATCLLLAFTDLLVGQKIQALSHFQGTVALLQRRHHLLDATATSSDTDHLSTIASSGNEQVFFIRDNMDLAGAILDIGTASYMLEAKPRLPKLDFSRFMNYPGTSHPTLTLELQVLLALHAGYTFAHRASRYKYLATRYHDPMLLIDQGREIGRLTDLIDRLGNSGLHTSWNSRRRALVLRTQCNSCLLYLFTILQPYETTYDSFTDIFISIVDDAEQIIRHPDCAQEDHDLRFSADLGTTQPLYLTATKSRLPMLRQRAIALLKESGNDGPFEGRQLAAVAQRAFGIEHSSSWCNNPYESSIEESVPEHRRVHGCGPAAETFDKVGGLTVQAFFSTCISVPELVAASSESESQNHKYWKTWVEEIAVP